MSCTFEWCAVWHGKNCQSKENYLCTQHLDDYCPNNKPSADKLFNKFGITLCKKHADEIRKAILEEKKG